jgi:dynein heavy chain
MAGRLKRDNKEIKEELVLMRALRDNNMPKFIFEDVPLFLGLISDLFPNMNIQRVPYEKKE